MLSFVAEEWFDIRGRGKIAVIRDNTNLDFSALVGVNVIIDGETYNVRGVEMQGASRLFGIITGYPR